MNREVNLVSWRSWAAWLVAVWCVAGLPATADEGVAASVGIMAQERARALAAELVRGVIDVQLRQLEENGLADRPIFADIQSLRGVVDALVQREMPNVIDLLGRAEEATPAERPALVTEARTRARAIVTRLAAERQQILRRLKEATLAAQARVVVDRQKRLLSATELLPKLPDGRREQAMLAAIEEERNVKTLVATLQAALDDVSSWGGEIGATGLAGLRALEKEGVREAVAAAEGRLAKADPAGAAAAQRHAIEGLEVVLATVEGSRATRPADAAATAGKEAAALGSRAAEMRREMAKVPLTDESVEKLLTEQSALQESLAKLADELRGEPVAALVEQAREASLEAAAGLLEGDHRRALGEQDAVIAGLAEVAARLDSARPATAPASAEEFAKRAAQLMDVLQKVEEFARRQDEISRAAARQPQAAVNAERQLSAAIAELAANDKRDTMPSAVEQRIAVAADAAAKVAEAPTPQAVQSALASATDAMQGAAREIAQAVADAKRAELAAKAGELSRAAEVTERAAAAEREIAQGAKHAGAMQPDGKPRQAGEGPNESAGPETRSPAEPLGAQQAEVAAIAEKVEDAVDGLAPEAAQMVVAAQAAMQAARKELAAREAAAERLADAKQALDRSVAESQKAAQQAAQEPAAPQAPADTTAAAETQAADPAMQQSFPQGPAEAAAQAAEALAEAAEAMRAEAKQAADEAKQATAREQQELVAKAKDLARAAQMADRAAAAERGIAERAEELAAPEKTDASRAADAPQREAAKELAEELAAKQAEVATVAETVEAAVQSLSPEAAEKMAAARAVIGTAIEQLEPKKNADRLAEAKAINDQAATNAKKMNKQAAADNAAAQKAAAEKMAAEQAAADKAAQAAAAEAAKAADALAQAAAAMRAKAKQAADELAREAARQAAAAAQARAAADEAVAARETALARDQIVAEEIAAALDEQSAAREAVAATAKAIEAMPKGDTATGDRAEAAAALTEAKERFADAQRDVGERVAAALDQREIGNQPLRESLEAASQQDDLGTGFLPESPETTADMIAGTKATAAAKESLAAAEGMPPDPQSSGPTPSGPEQSDSEQPQSQQANSQSQKSESQNSQSQNFQGNNSESQIAEQQRNQPSGAPATNSQSQTAKDEPSQSRGSREGEASDEGPLRETAAADKRADPGTRGGDAEAVEKSFERDAWFAKLPPEVRKAIRAGSERRAPRGYEEKMDRYFKNIE